jgi:hypothetical protein
VISSVTTDGPWACGSVPTRADPLLFFWEVLLEKIKQDIEALYQDCLSLLKDLFCSGSVKKISLGILLGCIFLLPLGGIFIIAGLLFFRLLQKRI